MNWDAWVAPRRAPSVISWLGAVWALSILGQWMQLFVRVFPADRFPDVLTLLVLVPLWNVLFLLLGSWIVNRALRRPIEQLFLIAWKALPFLLLPGLFNLLFAWFGLPPASLPFSSLGALPLEILTLGAYPEPLASWGALFTLGLSAVGCFLLLDQVTRRRLMAVRTTLLFIFGYLFLLTLPSFVGWFGMESATSFVTAGPTGVQRGLIFLSQEGYWWKNLYDRFPGTGIGEAQASVRLLLGAGAYLSLSAFAVIQEVKRRGMTLRGEISRLKPLGCLFFSSSLLFGIILGLIDGASLPLRFTSFVAVLLLLVSWLASWSFMIYRNDLFDLPEDEQRHLDYPLVSGEVDPRVWQERIPLLGGISLLGGMLLGWPVALSLFAFIAFQDLRSHPWVRLKGSFLPSLLSLAFSALAAFLVGWFFVGQETSVTGLSPHVLISFLIFFTLLFVPRVCLGPSGSRIKGLVEQNILKGKRPFAYAEAATLFFAYLLLPILLGWWRWLILSLPIGFISAFFLLSSQAKRSHWVVWLTFFFLISGFFLSLQGYSP